MDLWKRAFTGLLPFCLLAGCGTTAAPQEEHWDPSLSQILGLTQEERLEDYDYLVKTLGDSYLCMGVRDREHPDDPSADIFQSYREMILESDSDEAFYSALYSTLFRLGAYGHLWIVEPESYQQYLKAYQDNHLPDRAHWEEILGDPVTQTGYGNLQKLLGSYGEEAPAGSSTGIPEGDQNVRTLLLPDGQIGYMKIDSFPAGYEDSYAEDQNQLFAFYDTLSGCTDLIIDITDNSGGSEGYWQELLVSPFLDAPLSCTNYALLADSENNRPYIENAFQREELHPIADLPNLPNLNREGIEAATHYVESTLAAAPGAYRAPFRGDIWVLVGERVYSASESFSVFCKATGFASLVGTETGGDGIGALDPVFLRLPNSGLLIQYTMMFGLNPDGSSSEEKGTTPDILSPIGEPPLVTALAAIKSR